MDSLKFLGNAETRKVSDASELKWLGRPAPKYENMQDEDYRYRAAHLEGAIKEVIELSKHNRQYWNIELIEESRGYTRTKYIAFLLRKTLGEQP